jgi:hypothetical protein
MSALSRPWRRWAVAAPALTFVIAAFVLAPGGVQPIGMPSSVEVGTGGHARSSEPVTQQKPAHPAHPATAPTPAGTRATSTGTTPTRPTSPSTGRPVVAGPSSTPVTVITAQQPVVITGGEPGDDGWGHHPTGSPSPEPPDGNGGGSDDPPGDQ